MELKAYYFIGAGYHYHAATGKSTKISQSDGHLAMIGYALDGFWNL
jgi:hypothetical protein